MRGWAMCSLLRWFIEFAKIETSYQKRFHAQAYEEMIYALFDEKVGFCFEKLK